MIRIFSINKEFKPFTDPESNAYLKSNNIEFTDKSWKADIFLSPSTLTKTFKILRKFLFFKKMIIWTNEPRFDDTFHDFESKNQINMNVYSGNVFFKNTHFLASYHYDTSNNLGIVLDKLNTKPRGFHRNKFCAAIFGYKDPIESVLLKDGVDISLNAFRQDMALYFYKKGKADIFGSRWPNDVKVAEESGYESGVQTWWDRKIEVLSDYKYNICLENTCYPYYCTEKIWHAIFAGCLPIYSSKGTTIYETFPENSFIDASLYDSFEDILSYIENLPQSEYNKRFQLCMAVLEKELKTKSSTKKPEIEIVDKFVKNIHRLLNK